MKVFRCSLKYTFFYGAFEIIHFKKFENDQPFFPFFRGVGGVDFLIYDNQTSPKPVKYVTIRSGAEKENNLGG